MSSLKPRILRYIAKSPTALNSLTGKFCVLGSGITTAMLQHALNEMVNSGDLEERDVVFPYEGKHAGEMPRTIKTWRLTEKAFQDMHIES